MKAMRKWTSLRMVDLKAEMSKSGLPTKGNKAQLAQRLANDKDDHNVTPPQAEDQDKPTGEYQPRASLSSSHTVPAIHHKAGDINHIQHCIAAGSLVSPTAQVDKVFRRYRDLTDKQWVCLDTIPSHDQDFAIIRVYVLPDDTDNCSIDRASSKLRQKKKDLLATLDFSAATWNGASEHNAPAKFPPLSPAARLAVAHDEDGTSLLEMFNNIPFPNPDLNAVDNELERQLMTDLLGSAIDDVTTKMLPYQCRSAAMMHQKEVQATRFLDPRLIEVLDQSGGVYYYDPVTGYVLREPRYYEGVRGGILAEEMGVGKTLICLALIAATKHQPACTPETIFQRDNITVRRRVGSLMDMAAAVATKSSIPWSRWIEPWYKLRLKALKDNPGWYYLPRPESRRSLRGPEKNAPPLKIYLSHATLVVVPANLLEQWRQEVTRHTKGLKVHVIDNDRSVGVPEVPVATTLIENDIILASVNAIQALWQQHRENANGSWTFNCGLGRIRLKRCIVDEGHKLGNVRLNGVKTGLLQALDALHIDARWIATGTPAPGLFGRNEGGEDNPTLADSTAQQERNDLERIGAIATHYLKARPWSNTVHDYGDTLADWKVYIMQSRHNTQSGGRADCLQSTLNTLIIRHPFQVVCSMLPPVDIRVVKLDGSYQDQLCLNLFSMMIIFNAVQSQRTDEDYFFHPKNRKSLLELVNNLSQATFYGGALFSTLEIQKAVETAEDFIQKPSVTISELDSKLLRAGIAHGKVATHNKLKDISQTYHQPPIYVKGFPRASLPEDSAEGDSEVCNWSIDWKFISGLICTNWEIMVTAQKTLHPFLDPTKKGQCQLLYGAWDLCEFLESGSFSRIGKDSHPTQRSNGDASSPTKSKATTTLAGNTKTGDDHVNPRKRHSAPLDIPAADQAPPTPPQTPEESLKIPLPLADTQLVSTSSAKLSYLIDAIMKHQKDEQILVFYDNDNTAWYLAGMLEMLSVHHLIYAKGLNAKRRSQYVSTFQNHNTSKFRVLLVDIKQAAEGLNMCAASRVYFINPVLNPQVEAQAIGRVRRFGQKRRVTVETLVLKDSLEEVIMERKMSMTQAEHRNCKSILDDRPIYNWILNAKIVPLPEVDLDDGPAQMAPLKVPQCIFGLEFGRERSNPDEDILLTDTSPLGGGTEKGVVPVTRKRVMFADDEVGSAVGPEPSASMFRKRARFASPEVVTSAVDDHEGLDPSSSQ